MATITGTTTFEAGVSTWVRNAADLNECKLKIGGLEYYINNCGEYALYYLNSYGGWDSFLIEGTVKRIDNIENLTYEKYAKNSTSLDFENNKYQVNITPTYECHTGWLTDNQADNFAKNLLSTTQAYLHNLATGDIMPAMIDTNQAEYKTFKNNNRKFVSYTFVVKESQKKIKR